MHYQQKLEHGTIKEEQKDPEMDAFDNDATSPLNSMNDSALPTPRLHDTKSPPSALKHAHHFDYMKYILKDRYMFKDEVQEADGWEEIDNENSTSVDGMVFYNIYL